VGSYVRSHVGGVIAYDNRRIREELGMVFRPARESVLETVRDLERWGHLVK
jgi:dihydroflavonol-4-reductase